MQSTCKDHGRKGFGMGYATAWVTRNGAKITTTLHRKVYYDATGEWPEVVRHTCDNPRCINPEHLVGGTQRDNVHDMLSRGRAGDSRNFGSANGRCVVSQETVERIRQEYIPRSRTSGIPSLSAKYKVSSSQVWRIVNYEQRAA